MTAYVFETDYPLLWNGVTNAEVWERLRTELSDLTAGSIALDTLTNSGLSSGNTFARVAAGTTKFAYQGGTSTTLPGDRLLFHHFGGFEGPEFLAWWYKGNEGTGLGSNQSGKDQIAALLLAAGIDVVLFPAFCQMGESGGWYKETLTLDKLAAGKWSDGSQMNIRLASGDTKNSFVGAFPNVIVPSSPAATSFLAGVLSGEHSGGEHGDPRSDASQVNGLFPNYPLGVGGIIAAGLSHYYSGSWHSGYRGRFLIVNKTFHDSTMTATERTALEVVTRANALRSVVEANVGQDAIMEVWKGLGATIHKQMPTNVSRRIMDSAYSVLKAAGVADGTGAYTAILEDQIAFIKANQIRMHNCALPRDLRYDRTAYEADLRTI